MTACCNNCLHTTHSVWSAVCDTHSKHVEVFSLQGILKDHQSSELNLLCAFLM